MEKKRPSHPDEMKENSSRDGLIKQWQSADIKLFPYKSGVNKDSKGNIFRHPGGVRLEILGEQVMDHCETPWAITTVDDAFEMLRENGTKDNISVLVRGFGMGIDSTRIMHYLALWGGDYTCIELNNEIADYADQWGKKMQRIYEEIERSVMGGEYLTPPEIGIEIIRGDAFEETEKLADSNRKFDIIFSDTYPLSDEEQGVNDLLDLETVIDCLSPKGVFAFFGYSPDTEEGRKIDNSIPVSKYFKRMLYHQIDVFPPKSYKYLHGPSGAVTRLSAITCTNPELRLMKP